MKNFLQQGRVWPVTMTVATTSGSVVELAGAMCGVAVHDAKVGEVCNVETIGVYELKLKQGQAAPAVGTKVFWDATAVTGGVTDENDQTPLGHVFPFAAKAGYIHVSLARF